MRKLIIDWFDHLEENLRMQAFVNMTPSSVHKSANSLAQAIDEAFSWSSAPEGHRYWHYIYTKAEKIDEKTLSSFKISKDYEGQVDYEHHTLLVDCQKISFDKIDRLHELIHSDPKPIEIKTIDDAGVISAVKNR